MAVNLVSRWDKKKHRVYSRTARKNDRKLHNEYQRQSIQGLNSGETFSQFRKNAKKKKHNIF